MPLFEWTLDPALRSGPQGARVSVPPGVLAVEIGPVMVVRIHLPAELAEKRRQTGSHIPTPVDGFAMIDTGASRSAIDQMVCESLGLPALGVARVAHAGDGGPVEKPCCPALIEFRGQSLPMKLFPRLVAVDLGFSNESPLLMLLGRDFLSDKKFIYNGVAGRFEIAI